MVGDQPRRENDDHAGLGNKSDQRLRRGFEASFFEVEQTARSTGERERNQGAGGQRSRGQRGQGAAKRSVT